MMCKINIHKGDNIYLHIIDFTETFIRFVSN
jgi:hypothetical protein